MTALFVVLIGLLLSACSSSTDAGVGGEKDPVLSVPMVDLTTVRRFIPFGAALPGSGVLNPAYEMVVDGTATQVRAVTAGTVATVAANEQGDSELHIRPTPSSTYLAIYDHVLDVQVGVGDAVEAGTVLGRVGIWTQDQGRIELQVNHGNLAVCPRDLGTPEFNAAHDAALAAADPMEQDSSWTSVCLAETVQP